VKQIQGTNKKNSDNKESAMNKKKQKWVEGRKRGEGGGKKGRTRVGRARLESQVSVLDLRFSQ
jgi:hypothetical protein